MKSTVKEILDAKGGNVWTIDATETVYEALVRMAKKDVGALVVLDKGKLAGIFSERDYARKVILHGKASKESTVKEMMSSEVTVIKPETNIEECMTLMTRKHFRHLPVMQKDELLGIISIGDVVSKFISDQEITIKNLEDYIYGKPLANNK